jgi:RHH-type proline utilization regulon transcriptional repressor/proline dehydrogenase/delta 1-pyrroline-5-carboxylate dehydrogenase
VIRTAVGRAMREMGRQFVLGEDHRRGDGAGAAAQEAKGYTYSYDMLGEAARPRPTRGRFFDAYAGHRGIARAAGSAMSRANPGISVKLSALHPRYEEPSATAVMAELVPRVSAARRAWRPDAGIGFNIDAEEADRLTCRST